MDINISALNELLGNGGFWQINKRLVKMIGLEETLLLSDLLAKYTYFLGRNELDKNGFFFNTRENIEEDTTLTPYQQRKAISKLKKLGLVKAKEQGLPKKTYYKIDLQKLADLLLSYLTTSSEKTSPLDVKKLHINNNKDNKNKDNNISNENVASENQQKETSQTRIAMVMDLFKAIDKTYTRFFKNRTERAACEELLNAYPIEEIKLRVDSLPMYNKLPFMPSYDRIYKPSDLLRNWVLMEDRMASLQLQHKEKINKYPII